jgi:FkbM family methyltransferase
MKAEKRNIFTQIIKKILDRLLKPLNLQVVRENAYTKNLQELSEVSLSRYNESRNGFLFKFMETVNNPSKIMSLVSSSKGQLFQDLFVLDTLNYKPNGYFVEFGATNGKDLSNTYLLEKKFSWVGILAEPGKNWHEELISNRESYISTKCVWKSSGELINFNQTVYPEFSTIGSLTNFDGMEKSRESQEHYMVETISLQELLRDAGAPKFIDYLSIDTEGSEFEILSVFDFSEYQFGVLTVEHNHNHNETKIDQLLLDNGYVRVHRSISDFDGWYLNNSLCD